MQRLSIESFLSNGHGYDLYSYDEIDNVPQGVRVLPASLIVAREEIFVMRKGSRYEGSFGQFSDVFRYKLLLDRGGWWADLDMICLRPFHFTADYVFATERRQGGSLLTATCIIKAPKGSELFAECYERARTHEDRDRVWPVTGPLLLHEMIHNYGMWHFAQPADTFCPIDWWSAREILEPGEIPSNSRGIHLWNEMWRQAGWSSEPIYNSETLYQRLCRRYLFEDV